MSESKAEKKGPEPLFGKERVQILLHEYNGLRNEIIHRTNNLFQVITVGALVLGWVANSRDFDYKLVTLLFVGSVILVYFLWLIHRDIDKAAARLAEIEDYVDKETGEWYLLRWERLWGGRKTGYWLRARPLPVPPKPKPPEGPGG
jgi:hypothetical protein